MQLQGVNHVNHLAGGAGCSGSRPTGEALKEEEEEEEAVASVWKEESRHSLGKHGLVISV